MYIYIYITYLLLIYYLTITSKNTDIYTYKYVSFISFFSPYGT